MNRYILAAAIVGLSLPAVAQVTTPSPQTVTSGSTGSTIVVGQQSIAYTVATLPTCNANTKGIDNFYVTDATTPTYNAALTGGGAVIVPVFCNGTAWTSH
jgi:hypothetical protein